MTTSRFKKTVVWLTLFQMVFAQFAHAAQAVLATSPLSVQTTTVVQPNIMYVLDDSGSMAWDYTPDYVNDSESGSTTHGMCWGTTGMTRACPMAGGGGIPRDTNNSTCCNSSSEASLPWYTSDINYQYYDPAVRYQPPVYSNGDSYSATLRSDGTANPKALYASPTAAKSDGFAGTGGTNLTTSWPHQVWCTSATAAPTAADPTAGGKCLENADTSSSAYFYPDYTHVYPKTYQGPPTYFVMYPAEYCSDDAQTSCIRATTPTGAYTKPALFRWCASYTPALTVAPYTAGIFNNCQKKRDPTHIIPNYLGSWNPTGAAGAQAFANVRILSVGSGESITGLTVGGVDILARDGGGNILVGYGNTPSNPAAPGSDLGAPVNTAANIYSTIASGTTFPFFAGVADYTSDPYSATAPYKYFNYTTSTLGSPTDIAKALCQAVHANATSSGYDCPVTPTTDSLQIVANNIGSAPNNLPVVVSGPPAIAAVLASTFFDVITFTNNFKIDSILVNLATPDQLLNGSQVVTADGNASNTAQMICNAINTGAKSSTYEAGSGAVTGTPSYGSGACLNTGSRVYVRIKNSPSSTWNTHTIMLAGPAAANYFSGTLIVNAVSPNPGGSGSNATKIDDITIGGTSIVDATQKATLKWDGTQTQAQIATAITNAINNSTTRGGCSATVNTNTVTIAGTAAPCDANSAIVASASAVQASGTLRVVSVVQNTAVGSRTPNVATAPAQLGIGTTNGGVKVGAVKIADNVPETSITDGTAVSTNATSIRTKINALSTGLSAAAPSCSGSGTSTVCDIAVTTTDFRSTYNSLSFTPQQGNFQTGTGGTSPVWKFRIAKQDDIGDFIPIFSLKCGATNVITERTCKPTRNCVQSDYDFNDFNSNSVSTGDDNDNVGWLNKLGDSLEAQDINGYTVSCNNAVDPGATEYVDCTVTGPVGPANCGATDGTSLRINLHDTFDSVRNPETGNAYAEMDDAGTEYDYQDRYRITINTDGTGGSGTSYNDFSSAVSSQASFGSAYLAHSTTGSNLALIPSGSIAVNPSPATFINGVDGTVLAIPTTADAAYVPTNKMAGGSDAATANAWINIGIFKRTDVKPSVANYPRASTRIDCTTTSGACTYAEELQNFANWYTYYRTRMLTMKTTTTLAFTQLDDKYRVGFDSIANCQSGCSTTVKQPVGSFTDATGCTLGTNCQRSDWWNKLTASTPTSNTPLRSEAAKIGRYYAGKLTTTSAHPDPIQYSCQQNFMLLVTDGYWNEAERVMPDIPNSGAGITNTDNNSAATASPRPFYDGAMASTTCPTTGTSTRGSASSCRTMADIAWYYYSTDLRSASFGNATNAQTGADVSTNNVPISPDDKTTSQHMVFFGMGLGIDGLLSYRPDYATAGSGDYAEIRAGTTGYNWPAPKNLDPTAVDDLWHASVNGHGKYFSARNPTSVRDGLIEALNKMGQRVGAAAAAATSNLEPVSGDNFAYVASYVTDSWYGDVQSRSINLTTGAVGPDVDCDVAHPDCRQWSAMTKLDGQTWSTRSIYVAPSSGTSGATPRAFTYANLSATEKAWFDPSASTPTAQLSQYPTLFSDVVTSPYITASNLVDYLRGDRGLEQDGDIAGHAQIWRKRTHVLGDIVDTQPVFVKAPSLSYLDAGYSAFKSSGTAYTRNPVVYIAANDGMLHAINAHTAAVTMGGVSVQPGEELWSYIPTESLKAMKSLADVNYAHRYYIDGPITVSDVNFGANDDDWHTILVAGMGGGGKAYFALDITDPLNPKYLWEFTHANLGYTFGNASINKMPNGRWAVFFSSGYNNADGQGYLYAVDPKTGNMLSDATRGTLTGNANLVTADTVITSSNNTLDILVDGTTQSVTIPDGSYSQAALVNELQGLFNAISAGVKVAIAGNAISFTSYTYGVTSTVDTPSGTAATDLLGASPTSVVGINGTFSFPLTTASGDGATPSNLGKINAWANEPATNNTAEFIYGGDRNGDLWRFDLAPGTTGHTNTQVFKLASLTDPTTPAPGVGQPITTKPEMTRLEDGTHVIYVGTGQYLGTPDLTSNQKQTFYAIKDTLGADNLTSGAGQQTWTPRTDSKLGLPMFQQRKLIGTMNDGAHTPLTKTVGGVTSNYRQICSGASSEVDFATDASGNHPCTNESGVTMNWSIHGGWFVDLPDDRERMNVDMNLTLGTLTFATNVPHSSACTYGGSAWLNYIDYKTGLAVANTPPEVSIQVGSALIVGINVVKLPSGSLSAIATTSDNQQLNLIPSFSPSTFTGRRTLWREFEASY